MAQNALFQIEMPMAKAKFKLPKNVDNRLQNLLDRQDSGKKITVDEKKKPKVWLN